jgi:hypothetical protein
LIRNNLDNNSDIEHVFDFSRLCCNVTYNYDDLHGKVGRSKSICRVISRTLNEKIGKEVNLKVCMVMVLSLYMVAKHTL